MTSRVDFGVFLRIPAFKDIRREIIKIGIVSEICAFRGHRKLSHTIFDFFISSFLQNAHYFEFASNFKRSGKILPLLRDFSKFSEKKIFWSKIRFCVAFYLSLESSIFNEKS